MSYALFKKIALQRQMNAFLKEGVVCTALIQNHPHRPASEHLPFDQPTPPRLVLDD